MPCAPPMLSAREKFVLDVMAEFVRDDVLVELVGVFGDFGRQHDELRALAAVEEGLAARVVRGPVEHQLREVGGRRGAEHQLHALVDGIEDGERRRRRGCRSPCPVVLMPDGMSMLRPVPALELKVLPSVYVIGHGVDGSAFFGVPDAEVPARQRLAGVALHVCHDHEDADVGIGATDSEKSPLLSVVAVASTVWVPAATTCTRMPRAGCSCWLL